MTIWWLVAILGCLLACFLGFVWVLVSLNKMQAGGRKSSAKVGTGKDESFEAEADEDTSHLFNKAFREELRNRGRLRLESIIEENAMFLKHDLDLTAAQLNDYMKKQVASKLDTEFTAYAKTMRELQEMAQDSLQKVVGEVEEQRKAMSQTLKEEVEKSKATALKTFEDNMAEVVQHYVLEALGDQFDLKAQLPYIMQQLEANKEDIKKDMEL